MPKNKQASLNRLSYANHPTPTVTGPMSVLRPFQPIESVLKPSSINNNESETHDVYAITCVCMYVRYVYVYI